MMFLLGMFLGVFLGIIIATLCHMATKKQESSPKSYSDPIKASFDEVA